MGPGHDWVRNDDGWFCKNCHVTTAFSVNPPSADQKFTPTSSGITLRIGAKEGVFEAYDCEEMQLYEIHVS